MEKYLPIGTVCLLKNAKKRVMVTGFAAKGKETGDKMFDYIGCLYPEGVISSDKNLLFNHDQIDKIFYMGYVDDEQKELMKKLKSYLAGNNATTNNGSVVGSASNINNLASNQGINKQVQSMPEMPSGLTQVQQPASQSIQQPIEQSQIVFDPKRDEIFNSVPNQ